ncbi:hypothetical protein FHT70_000395 [Rhizobium sp. BK049]|nr:hypothetical protein [Rhizobium sp. BK049]
MEVHLLEARGAKKRFPEYKERTLTWLGLRKLPLW